jgi:multiple sugar transport system substrate-binding protein
VFDYPFAGEALNEHWVHDLATVLDAEMLAQRRAGMVGPAFDSFVHEGRLAAVQVDVATHVAVVRHDLLDGPLPTSLAETVALTGRTGEVAIPLRPTGVWGAFLSLCANAGDTPLREEHAFDRTIAAEALAWLTSPEIQAGLYVAFAGQPAQRAAWQDDAANALTQNFFRNTLESAEEPFGRPNRPGFHAFQNFAATRLHRAVIDGGGIAQALDDVARGWARA